MAAPPLGKCIVLSLLLLLFYVGYGFRIRDVAVGEHGECILGGGKCPGDNGGQVTFGGVRKGATLLKLAASAAKQPPVEAGVEHAEKRSRSLANRIALGKDATLVKDAGISVPVGNRDPNSDDDDDDDEDGIVEEDDDDVTEEVTISDDDDDDDDDNDDDIDEDDTEETSKPEETVKRDTKWSFRVSKITKPDNDDSDDVKPSAMNRHVDGKRLPKKSEKPQEEEEDDDDDDSGESSNAEDSKERPKGEDIASDEVESEEVDKREPELFRKLEKVRLADKLKSKVVNEVASVDDTTEEEESRKEEEKMKKESKSKVKERNSEKEREKKENEKKERKNEEKEKERKENERKEKEKKESDKEKEKKENERKENEKMEKERKENEKKEKERKEKERKEREKEAKEKEKKEKERQEKEKAEAKEKEEKDEAAKKEKKEKAEEKERKEREKEKKQKEKAKEDEKTGKKEKEKEKKSPKEAQKTKEAKEKEKTKDLAKDKPKEPTAARKPKTEVTKESEVNKKKPNQSARRQDGSISLSELNDLILQVPNFVPNFTGIEDAVCQQHGKIFLRQLRGRKLWALQMLDSSGKIPSGLLRGNANQFGDFDQCLGISSKIRLDNKQTLKIQGKYCLASVDLQATVPETRVPVNLVQSRGFLRGNMKDSGHFVPKFTTINWALCIPSACSASDARSAIEAGLSHLNGSSGVKFLVDVDPDMCYVHEKSQSYTKETIGVLYFYAMIVCLALIATVRDYIVVSEKASYSERIIMSFSLRRTFKSLTKPIEERSGDISCIHGIRALATMVLYVAHKMIPTAGIPYTNRIVLTEISNNPISSVLRVSLVYTDSFLLLSGVLTAFHMARESTTCGEIRWVCRFIARIIRLTPSLLVVIFWYAYVMEHTGSGPQWNNIITANAELCKQNSWTNLLYIQNFFPFEEMCATHTHQLALDMQLSLLAPTLVFFLLVKPIIGILLIFFFLQVSATLRYFATTNNNLSLVIFHGMTAKHLYKTANLTYAVSIHRATPYLFGISLGVLLQYTGRSVKIYKILVIFGWITASFLGLWSLFSPWRMARRDYIYNVEESVHYAVIGPVSWALTLCWVIFACYTNHGGVINKLLSSYWLILFSRISYSVYLTQFAVFFYNVATTRYSSEFQVLKVVDPYEVLTVISISVVLTLFLDIPTQEIKNVLMESTASSQSSKVASPASPKPPKQISRKPSKTPEPRDYTESSSWRRGQIEDYSDEDSHWRSPKPNGKQRVFVRRNSREDDGCRPWGTKRDDVIERRRSNSAQRPAYNESDQRIRDALASRRSEEPRHDRRSSSRTLDPKQARRSEDRRSPRRDHSSSRLSDRGYYREEPVRPVPKPESRGRSPRLRKTPVRLMSSGSEDDPKLRGRSPRRPVERPRVSDEDDWEQELRIRRQKFRERMASAERQETKQEKEESTDVSRRSSAEGKIALLQGPTGTRVMEAWTVSKGPRVSVASSQEPTDTEEESRYIRDFEDEPIPERRGSLDSLDKEDLDFSFRSDVKTKTLMDLRQLSAEDDIYERKGEAVGEMTPVATGKLFKRESIIKSQASEEDPEYLLPERPKLVEQEQEHPFKKAWQMQKSRSEEDGPAAFAFKEVKAQPEGEARANAGSDGNVGIDGANDRDGRDKPRAGPTEQTFHLIVEDVDSGNWHRSGRSEGSRSSVTGSSFTGSSEDMALDIAEEEPSSRQSRNEDYDGARAKSNGESPQMDWPSEDEQFERERGQRRESETWEQESDEN